MRTLLLLIVCLVITIASCKKDDNPPIPSDRGIVVLNIGITISESELVAGRKAEVPLDEFKVKIFREDGVLALSYDAASQVPDSIFLEPGRYYITADSDNDLPAGFENPWYYGVSEVFTVNSNQLSSVSLLCKLANTMVSVVYSDSVINSFSDFSTRVITSEGNLLFSKTETRYGYFRTLPIEIESNLTWLNPDGSPDHKTLQGSIPEPLPGKHYRIEINASIDKGMGSLHLILDDSEIPVEVVSIGNDASGTLNPDTILGFGDLLITEIMADPNALSDTEGEYIELLNNSAKIINLKGLVIKRDTNNSHCITGDIELLPGDYYVLARSVNATNTPGIYIYGSSISLPNSGAVLSIYNKGESGELLFSVNYGAENFPSKAGSSISLNPLVSDPSLAAIGTSWCLSASTYNTGDFGTPGIENNSCN